MSFLRNLSITLLALVVCSGCAQVRRVSIVADPPDAAIRIGSAERGVGPVRHQFAFTKPEQSHTVTVTRFGFETATVPVTLATAEGELRVGLKPLVKPVTVHVTPAEASISLDGRPVGDGPAASVRFDLPFALDGAGQPAAMTLRAQRLGYAPVETTIRFTDSASVYELALKPLVKDLLLDTTPSGATLTLDGADVGVAPVRLSGVAFDYDPRGESFIPKKLIATRVGYRPTELQIGWDEGRPDYAVSLEHYAKSLRLKVEPPDAAVKVDGKPLPKREDGMHDLKLEFPPIDVEGSLRGYGVEASLNRPGEIWKPLTMTLAWDDGRENYTLALEEILQRPTTLGGVAFSFRNNQWSPAGWKKPMMAFKDVADGTLGTTTRVTDLPAGSSPDTFAISPDGKLIVLSVIEQTAGDNKPRARLIMARTDGVGGTTNLTDGKHLDLTPTFSPAGDRILFASNRGGARMQIWSLPVDGVGGVTRITAGDVDALWPTLDSSPKPRVFYQSLVPQQPEPRVYSTQVGTVFDTDLTTTGGLQPRLSPRDDLVVFTLPDRQSGKTDLYQTPDVGGVMTRLTETPDIDERDPAVSTDGTRIVFAADVLRGSVDRGDLMTQSDLFIVPVKGGTPVPVTVNPAIDDRPGFDPLGDAIYFRSNRGGKWDIWRIELK
jgi:Tol biopolymer transport system component